MNEPAPNAPALAAGYGPPGPPGFGPPAGGFGPPAGGGGGGFGQPPGGPPGHGPPGYGPSGYMMGGGGPKTHPLAVTSLVTGILAIPACCCWFAGAPLSITAIITGILALGKVRNDPHMFKGGGLAIAGIILGGVALILWIIGLVSTFDDNLRRDYGPR